MAKGKRGKSQTKRKHKKNQRTDAHRHKSRAKAEARKQARGQPKTAAAVTAVHGLDLKEVDYTVPPKTERKATRKAFNPVRAEFLQYIGREHRDLLEAAGLSKSQIALVAEGKTPNGFNTHHKLPIHGGGRNVFGNLLFTKISPYHDDFHRKVIDVQIKNMKTGETRRVKIPWTEEPVFLTQEQKRGLRRQHDALAKNVHRVGKPKALPAQLQRAGGRR